jgi:hypothetical protein
VLAACSPSAAGTSPTGAQGDPARPSAAPGTLSTTASPATDGREAAIGAVEDSVGENGCVTLVDVTIGTLSDAARQRLLDAAVAAGGGWLFPGGPGVKGQFWLGSRTSALAAWNAYSVGEPWAVARTPTGPVGIELIETTLAEGLTLWSIGDRVERCADEGAPSP